MNTYIFEFMIWLLAAELIFSKGFPYRKRFVLRAACGGCGLAAVAVILTATLLAIDFTSYYVAYLVVMLLVVTAYIALCYDVKIFPLLYIFAGGYAAQHISYSLFRICLYAFKDRLAGIWAWYLVEYACIVATYLFIYFVFVHNKVRNVVYRKDKKAFFISLFILFVNLILSDITTNHGELDPFLANVVCKLYAIACCILLILLENGYFRENRLKYEKEMVSYMYKEREHQYDLSVENIKHINIKLHDIRHQLRALKTMGEHSEEREKYVSDLEKSVTFSGCMMNTGNRDVDIILTEKMLYCNQNGIRLNVNVENGGVLGFMESLDIYALLGNALDNAINSVRGEERAENKYIDFKLCKKNGAVSIGVENYCGHKVGFSNGMPVTQRDRNYHGFGVLSMKQIVKKYGGAMRFELKDNVFYVGIVFFK